MPVSEYMCSSCGERQTVADHSDLSGACQGSKSHEFKRLPPRVAVVIATALFMQEYQLDSYPTVYELDRVLNIEARAEKETLFYQDHIRNV